MILTYTANQPLFFPKIYMVRRFIEAQHVMVMMEAQYTSNDGQESCYLQKPDGKAFRFGLKLVNKNRRALSQIMLVREVEQLNRLLLGLGVNFKESLYFYDVYMGVKGIFEAWLKLEHPTVARLSLMTMQWVKDVMDLDFELHESTDYVARRPLNFSEWIAELGTKLGARIFVCGIEAPKKYLDVEILLRKGKGIRVVAQNWKANPTVGDTSLSILQLLLNEGPVRTKELLLKE